MYIYADILIITNIYADFLLIKSTQAITHSTLKTLRGIIAAVVGSLFSLIIFLPGLPSAGLAAIKLISAVSVVFTAFGAADLYLFFKRVFVFLIVSFIYAGIGTGFSYLIGNNLIISRNGVIYADFSFSALVITSVAAYAFIALYKRFADCSDEGSVYTIIVSECGKTISFRACADTGNMLKDSFSGKPIIVCSNEELEQLYGKIPDENEMLSYSGNRLAVKCRWRFIPYSTVCGSGLMAVICPADICIKNEETGRLHSADVLLGASKEKIEAAVFNPKILI